MKTINLPSNVDYIIEKLNDSGFEAYAVGGCVRDSILGKAPKDWDITTSAEPYDILRVFRNDRIVPTGLKHGTVTILIGKSGYEVTTYRIDGDYHDGRHPDRVSFTKNLREDLNRRDFTINAMAYSRKTGLIDHFRSLDDLSAGIIRCVGDAEARLAEDYLRMLRAYRFAAVLDFNIEETLAECCLLRKQNILNISAERIRAEFDKLITDGTYSGIRRFFDDFSDVLLPEIFALKTIEQNNKYHYLNVYDHTMEVIKNTERIVSLRLAALFHDTGKALCQTTDSSGCHHFKSHQLKSVEIARNIMKRLKYDNKTLNDTLTLVRTHDDRIKSPSRKAIRRLINRLGAVGAYKNLQIQRADIMGQSKLSRAENLPLIDECFSLYRDIIRDDDPCEICQLKVTGDDIMETLNIKPGKMVGEILDYLMNAVLDDPELNDREKLISMARSANKNGSF